ncbi:MAG: ribonuclease P protein component [Candidatus Moraniibacteriota bacterium]
MLPKKARLRAKENFEQAFRGGKTLHLGEILCLFTTEKEKETKIGVAFKGKAFPKAATRHLYKRKILAALRPRLPLLPPHLHLVLLFQKKLADETFSRFEGKADLLIQKFIQPKK